ncbi:hypothetical protein BBK14_16370 [Parafrankia soli]|uniref:ABC transporter domain-containing protein n=1 Tax=Parafrankia soli TaxID=2599596 RepID=A0A1S1QB13_9ACTN|nr:hypothetical protein BBK14_16370 [Parafrankia soli]
MVRVEGLTIGPSSGPPVVEDVGFEVRRGEAVALVGRSGAGKTTTALALLGHVAPGLAVRSGTVRVVGEDVLAAAVATRLRGRTIAYLGQDPASDLHPTRRLRAQLREAARSEADVGRLLSAVGLPTEPAFQRRYAHQISGGQAQRAAFALVLAGQPDILVLDEPTAGLDAVLTRAIRDLIGELAARHAVVLVSHDRALVDAVATRTVTLGARHPPAWRPPGVGTHSMPAALAPTPAAPVPGTAVPGTAVPDVLSVSGLRAWHGRLPALVGIDLTVPGGGCVAVVGPSGSGKSTLARCIAGIHRGRALATMRLAGAEVPVTGRRAREQRRAVALVPQDSVGALNPRESVRRALLRAAGANLGPHRLASQGGPGHQTDPDALVTELLGQVGLPAGHADRRPGALSGGERQRVSLARALACQPRLLLCDEVTSALDSQTGEQLLELLAGLRTRLGLGVLMITHDLSAARHAEWTLVLADGAIVDQGPPETLRTSGSHPVTQALFGA